MPSGRVKTESDASRFAKKHTAPEKGCWEWVGRLNRHGYGVFSVAKRATLAHRVSIELRGTKIPPGLCVLHKCDNRKCVNPIHLMIGTQAENVADMMKKRRNVSVPLIGERNPQAKLKADQVTEIKRLHSAGVRACLIAAEFGISQSTVSMIVNGKRWKRCA